MKFIKLQQYYEDSAYDPKNEGLRDFRVYQLNLSNKILSISNAWHLTNEAFEKGWDI